MWRILLIGAAVYLLAAFLELMAIKHLANYDTSTERVTAFAIEARKEISRKYATSADWSTSEHFCKEFSDNIFSYHLCARPVYREKCASPSLSIRLVPHEPILSPEPIIGVDRLEALDREIAIIDPDNEFCLEK